VAKSELEIAERRECLRRKRRRKLTIGRPGKEIARESGREREREREREGERERERERERESNDRDDGRADK